MDNFEKKKMNSFEISVSVSLAVFGVGMLVLYENNGAIRKKHY